MVGAARKLKPFMVQNALTVGDMNGDQSGNVPGFFFTFKPYSDGPPLPHDAFRRPVVTSICRYSRTVISSCNRMKILREGGGGEELED